MKMTEVLGIPAVQHTDMTRVINIQNGAPVTDGEVVIRPLSNVPKSDFLVVEGFLSYR